MPTAKNIILAGVRSVGLWDPNLTSIRDLSTNFYLEENEIGKISRAESVCKQLSSLNHYVDTHIVEGELNEGILRKYSVVVACDIPLQKLLEINKITRKFNIKFIAGSVLGLFGFFFNDLLDHTVYDKDGEELSHGLIGSISSTNPAIITTLDTVRHTQRDNDYVKFDEIVGQDELNNINPLPIKRITPYSFSIPIDLTKSKPHKPNTGTFIETKKPIQLHFNSLEDCIHRNDLFCNDINGDSQYLHKLYLSIENFRSSNDNNLPLPNKFNDAIKIVNDVENNCTLDDTKRVQMQNLARISDCIITPMAAIAGGILGQEVLKGCSGKFTPIYQFMYINFNEVSPNIDIDTIDTSIYEYINTRYDDYIGIFGKDIHDKITKQNIFLIGAGAIGCEMLKNWAMMGVSTNNKNSSCINITDMDVIERSNLNRQFLFRPNDVGSFKSITACNAIKLMNKDININANTLRTDINSEIVYNDDFWNNLDSVYTALDNVEARNYIDSRCVYYKKPLIDSGTLGTKGNTQVIQPYKTESYSSVRDPPEVGIPVCTLKNFPYKIEHTIQWARDWFEGTFKQIPDTINSYRTNKNYLYDLLQQPVTLQNVLEILNDTLINNTIQSKEDCIIWSRRCFDKEFNFPIQQLCYNFPKDYLTSEGVPFWSGTKRYPKPIYFNINDELHYKFIYYTSNLLAQNYGYDSIDNTLIDNVLKGYIQEEFHPKQVIIHTDDNELQKNQSTINTTDIKEQIDNFINKVTLNDVPIQIPINFEKDDDSNHHISLITSCSNLRARSYNIKETNDYETKFIAGKITPAIATTTSIVTGLVCLEMYKQQQNKPVESFRNTYLNIAINLLTSSEPTPPIYTTTNFPNGKSFKWSLWDMIEIDEGRDLTLQEFIDLVETTYGVHVDMINYTSIMLYVSFQLKNYIHRLNVPISRTIESVLGATLPLYERYIVLECALSNDSDEDVEVPPFRVRFR